MRAQLLSCVRLFATPWTAACQATWSMGFSRQEFWGGWPFPLPRDFPDPGIKPVSPEWAGGFSTTGPPESPGGQVVDDKEEIQ